MAASSGPNGNATASGSVRTDSATIARTARYSSIATGKLASTRARRRSRLATFLTQSGFARGNFNYRIDSVGVNFVGSSVRNCEGTNLTSTCYAAGFLPYSLQHLGPLFVRNHTGQQFEVKLFTGNVEHARGLALERYLTNPLPETDRQLFSPYVRTEFKGRPLDGNFILRVWDEPGVNFDAIEDAQIYIKYRYWTRFD